MYACITDVMHVAGASNDIALNGRQLTRSQLSVAAASHPARHTRHKPVWYQCDDAAVTTLTEDKLLLKLKDTRTFTPYLLFYTKCYQ